MLTGDKTRFITNKRCADMFGSGEVMKNSDELQLTDDFAVEAVPAYNYTEGRTQFLLPLMMMPSTISAVSFPSLPTMME